MYIASSSKWIISALSGAAAIVALPVLAAGFGEPRPIKFETPSERQVLHYAERDRQSLNAAKKKGGCCAGGGGLGEANAIGSAQGAEATVNYTEITQNIDINVSGEGHHVVTQGGSQVSDQNAEGILQDNTNTIGSASERTENRYLND
jgi:hypothetical protein